MRARSWMRFDPRQASPSRRRIGKLCAVEPTARYDGSMTGPFPGMDPYLERRAWWTQVHPQLVHALAEQLSAGVASPYHVDVDYDVLPGANRRRYYLVLRADGALPITVVEVLSYGGEAPSPLEPSRFTARRDRVLASSIHWVEIDLLRTGAEDLRVEGHHGPGDYQVIVSRADPAGRIHVVHPFSVRDPLPAFDVPLNGAETVHCDLGAAVDRAYVTFCADQPIAYGEPAMPPLLGSAAAWADRRLRAAGLRA